MIHVNQYTDVMRKKKQKLPQIEHPFLRDMNILEERDHPSDIENQYSDTKHPEKTATHPRIKVTKLTTTTTPADLHTHQGAEMTGTPVQKGKHK